MFEAFVLLMCVPCVVACVYVVVRDWREKKGKPPLIPPMSDDMQTIMACVLVVFLLLAWGYFY